MHPVIAGTAAGIDWKSGLFRDIGENIPLCYDYVCEKSGRIDTRARGNYGRDIPLSRD